MIYQKSVYGLLILLLISCGQNHENKFTTVISASEPIHLSDSTSQINYFKNLTEPDFISKAFWDSINFYKENYNFGIAFHNSKAFQYLLSHREEFEKLHTADSIQIIICRAFEFSLKEASKDSARFDQIRKEIIANTGDESKRIFQHIEMANYYDAKDFINYSRVAVEYLDKYCQDEEGKLNWTAWKFYEHVENKGYLQKALAWSKRAIELSGNYRNLDTYAHLLYKLGKTKDAHAVTEKAIEKAKQNNENYTSSTNLLEKIRQEDKRE